MSKEGERITDRRRFDREGNPIPGNDRSEPEAEKESVNAGESSPRAERMSALMGDMAKIREEVAALNLTLDNITTALEAVCDSLPPDEQKIVLDKIGAPVVQSEGRTLIGFLRGKTGKPGKGRKLGAIGFAPVAEGSSNKEGTKNGA